MTILEKIALALPAVESPARDKTARLYSPTKNFL
jgi:hypothetical protein